MDTVVIGIRSCGKRFINYNRKDLNIPEDTEIMTMKDLSEKELNEIKNSTINEVQNILAKYL